MSEHIKYFSILLLISLFFPGCAQLSPEDKSDAKTKIDTMAKTTIDTLIENSPEIFSSLENAQGYAVVNWKVTKVPVVGAGGGDGVIVNKSTGERKYIKVRRFDFGGGWGARSFKNLVIIHDEAIINKAMAGGSFKFEAGAEVAAGTAGVEGGSGDLNKGIESHMLLDGGGSATATVRFIYFTMDKDLN